MLRGHQALMLALVKQDTTPAVIDHLYSPPPIHIQDRALDCYLDAVDAAKLVPGQPHPNTVRRWWLDGVKNIKLRSVRAGRRRVTTARWLSEFFAKLGEVN